MGTHLAGAIVGPGTPPPGQAFPKCGHQLHTAVSRCLLFQGPGNMTLTLV